MPDWTYHTVFRPILSRLPYSVAQQIVFGSLGRLGAFAPGRWLIRMMGHAAPHESLAVTIGPWKLPSPVGLSCGIDLRNQATSALSMFGFGLIEVGPVAVSSRAAAGELPQWEQRGSTITTGTRYSVPLAELQGKLSRKPSVAGVKTVARLEGDTECSVSELESVCAALAPFVDGFVFSPEMISGTSHGSGPIRDTLKRLHAAHPEHGWLLELPDNFNSGIVNDLVGSLPQGFPLVLIVAESAEADGRRKPHEHAMDRLADLRETLAESGCPRPPIAVRSQLSEPGDALRIFRQKADLVFVGQGMIEAGPGLPKRINSSLMSSRLPADTTSHSRFQLLHQKTADSPTVQQSWFWTMLLATGLLTGGVLALVLGLGRVLLPYDEEFLGMVRAEVCSINDNLLPFMSHDRVTLAGTMIALGTLYTALSAFGDRRGMHWARVAILASGFVGFLSFFLFLGFGYFDPFHAFVTCIMFQFLAIALRSGQSETPVRELDLKNSSSWKRALWGQLLLIMHGTAVLAGGLVICTFGVTTVFVEDDLQFMQTSVEYLTSANSRLIPLVAHDRASFGGMLISCGLAVVMSAAWGWQRGRRWLWYAFAAGGTVGYGATLGIHWWVGYTSLRHLIPAYAGLLSIWLALLLSMDWMFEDAEDSCDTA